VAAGTLWKFISKGTTVDSAEHIWLVRTPAIEVGEADIRHLQNIKQLRNDSQDSKIS
jgi:hypothetical protein